MEEKKERKRKMKGTKTRIAGKIIAAIMAAFFQLFIVKPYSLMNLDKANAVANLANSAGCKLTGPKFSQEREPFVSGAMTKVMISNTINAAYIR